MEIGKSSSLNFFGADLFIFKPTKTFWLTTFVCFILWISQGPLYWRHYDDYEVLNNFLSWLGAYGFSVELNTLPANLLNNVLNFIGEEARILKFVIVSLFLQLGFGTYPPIWNSIYLSISAPFIAFGIDVTRWVIIFLGFFINILSACLLSSIVANIFITLKRVSNFKKVKNSSDFLSVVLITLNPEILLHSQSYMAYQLPILTTLIFLNLLYSRNNREQILILSENDIYQIPFFWKISIIYVSILLGYQSIIIFVSLIILYLKDINLINVIYRQSSNLKFQRININKFFKEFYITNLNRKNIIKSFLNFKMYFIGLLILFGFAYVYQFLRIFLNELNVGEWSMGIDDIYNLQSGSVTLVNFPLKIYEIIIRLCSLSLYPFRNGQSVIGLFSLIFIIIAWINLHKSSKYFQNASIFSLNLLLISFLLSFMGKFNLSPTRHSLFIFPIFWIPVIFQLIKISLNFDYKTNKLFINLFFLIPIFSFYSFGCIKSFNQINYTSIERNQLISMAKEAQLFPSSDGQYDYSLFWTHGTKEFNSVSNKFCKKELNNRFAKKAFLFSHRNKFNLNDPKQREFLEIKSKGCISRNDEIKILKSIERINQKDIEMDSRIYNGGSNIFGYLVEVK